MPETLNGSNTALAEYLASQRAEPNALSRLLSNPDGREGITFTPREILQQPFLWRETARFKALGARTLVLTAAASDVGSDAGITVMTYDQQAIYQIPRHHQVNMAALLGQMLGLFASYRMGLNVDEPTAGCTRAPCRA